MVLLDKSLIPQFGISGLDEEHNGLVNLINQIYDATSHKNSEDIYNFIDYFLELTVEHFMSEERTMAAYHYPGISMHAAAHATFIDMVKDLRDDARMASVDDLRERLLGTLLPEFLCHTREQDASFRDFLSLRANDTYLGRSDKK